MIETVFLAKSSPRETIEEHTSKLLNEFETLKDSYRSSFKSMGELDWELLYRIVSYHDVGKMDKAFQKYIKNSIGLEYDEPAVDEKAQHNFLSAMMMPVDDLSENDQRIAIQAVVYHHERDKDFGEEISKAYNHFYQNIQPMLMSKCFPVKELSYEVIEPSPVEIVERRIENTEPEFVKYVLLKGLLHRLDHAASAGVPVETGIDVSVANETYNFVNENFKKLRPLQEYTYSHQNENLFITAQTGIGKTEAALLWIGDRKAFFTLPLQVSLNALYNRLVLSGAIFKNGKEFVGLLHANSLDYITANVIDDESTEALLREQNPDQYYVLAKQFSQKLTVCTVDQILKFPLFYRGFEKELATLAGSKLVIDEIQAYDPKISAILLVALEWIDRIGGQFLVMSATFPPYWLDKIRERNRLKVFPQHKTFIDDNILRHKVAVRDCQITEMEVIKEIGGQANKMKILVICNTVRKAQELFRNFRNARYSPEMLHARFTKGDREVKERQLIKFSSDQNQHGIWITTQVVEASLDIDFDLLYTELAPLDSLFQRMGRVNRKGQKEINSKNVHVFCDKVSGMDEDFYDPKLLEKSRELLLANQKEYLKECIKLNMHDELYSTENVKGLNFYDEFEKALNELDHMPAHQFDKKRAQAVFRDIDNVTVIPKSVWESMNLETLEQRYLNTKDIKKRTKLRRIIEKGTLSIRQKWTYGITIRPLKIPALRHILIVDLPYNFQEGLARKNK